MQTPPWRQGAAPAAAAAGDPAGTASPGGDQAHSAEAGAAASAAAAAPAAASAGDPAGTASPGRGQARQVRSAVAEPSPASSEGWKTRPGVLGAVAGAPGDAVLEDEVKAKRRRQCARGVGKRSSRGPLGARGPGKDGRDWWCRECQASSFARRLRCYHCDKPRAEVEEVAAGNAERPEAAAGAGPVPARLRARDEEHQSEEDGGAEDQAAAAGAGSVPARRRVRSSSSSQ